MTSVVLWFVARWVGHSAVDMCRASVAPCPRARRVRTLFGSGLYTDSFFFFLFFSFFLSLVTLSREGDFKAISSSRSPPMARERWPLRRHSARSSARLPLLRQSHQPSFGEVDLSLGVVGRRRRLDGGDASGQLSHPEFWPYKTFLVKTKIWIWIF